MKKGKIQGGFSALAVILALTMVFSAALSAPAAGIASKDISSLRLTVGGEPFGARLKTDGVLVVGCGKFTSGGENRSPALDAGIEKGDLIIKMNDITVETVEEAVTVIENCSGIDVSVTVLRGGKEKSLTLCPMIADEDGLYKAGLWIKDSSAGIGTVTFIDPETLEFAGLGHGVTDIETEILLPFREGSVEGVLLESLVKGEEGKPGELRGSFTGKNLGTLTANEQVGVFGIFNELPEKGESLPVAKASEVKDGKAEIVCTLDSSGRQYYDIDISEINRSGEKTKSFVISITDSDLIEKCGGIIQGMSGSPVVQNGKLIGAVTHVLVNDPTKGYGIFVENMIKQTPNLVN